MRYAIVENGTVVNVAKSEKPLFDNWIRSDLANIGDTYSKGQFSTPAPDIPKVVSMRQARLALLESGHLSTVESAIAALTYPTKEAVQIEWEYSATVERDHSWVQSLAEALSLDLDDLFQLASTK